MNTPTRRAQPTRCPLLIFVAILLPRLVGAQPVLSVNPSGSTNPIVVEANVGTNAPSQTVQVRNTGSRALKWTLGPLNPAPANWQLSVSPTSGGNSATLTLTFTTSALSAGTYNTSFEVRSTTAVSGSPATVYVQVKMVGSAPPPPPPGADITVSPTTAGAGSGVSVSFSGIPNPTSRDWISLAPAGSSPQTYVAWVYASSCTQTPGTAKASGSCPFTAPSTAGNYEFRLFPNDQFTLLDSVSLMVMTSTPPPVVDVTVSPTTAAAGSAVTVSFSGIPNPTSRDWITLAPTGSFLQTYLDWKYASSCTQSPGTAKASGSCPFTAPSTAGNYELRLFADDQYTLLGSVTLTVATSTIGVGPQSTITCPAGAVDIWPGSSIQSVVNLYPGATTFCLRAGVHYLNSSITPNTGNVFVGEYGAILDGTGWTTSDETQAAFRSHESPPQQHIGDVTIRNLVIRNMPQRGIHAWYSVSDHWTIEYNDISTVNAQTCCAGVGVVFPSHSMIRNNYIHDNIYSAYMGAYAHHSTLESNEIAYNGWHMRVRESDNVTFRNNFVHHNAGPGIWYDSNNTGGLVEGNRVEDNGWIGIIYEISSDGIIRNNTLRRHGDAGVFLGTSKNTQIYNNTLENNFRGITYYLNCPSVGGPTSFDLANNSAHDNTITVGTQSGAFASLFSYGTDCTSTQTAPYLNGSKNLTFSNNTYYVPSPTTGRYWIWGRDANGQGVLKYWNEWQAIPQDATGTVRQQ